ncbi:putative allantoin permease [Vagococcus fluvialis]|uniref:allantoin permease n=1 Tax=Vagococcus fluvialis TaxID=2738 RepID=UPI001A8F4E2E|nr:putative allantoin permease [Vagococcus fluvialis]MBO0479893.1 putative allantoin permease [Vagococcus fluvialis]MBO0485476.1 putative allantoin permease [Vagococcus fluvialis]
MEVDQKNIPLLKEGISFTEEELEIIKSRGYNKDLLPKTNDNRQMSAKNYFTLWMGSVHNVPNYAAVGGFLFLGLSPINIMMSLIISSACVALLMVLNGEFGSKYGIGFSMQLRSVYGNIGAKLPGFLRGGIAAIAWFGLQNYTTSLALLILVGKVWPGFLTLGGNFNFFGISLPGLITFILFWAINVLIGLGGGKTLNKFTAILNPLIYVVFIGMTVWAVRVGGGLRDILTFTPTMEPKISYSPLFLYLMIINSVLAVWAGPIASVSDFTQNAKSTKAQRIGQTASLVVGYTIFAFSSITILIGGSLYYGIEEWNVLNIVEKWDNLPAMLLAIIVLLMTTISTNATGNIVPAAYQLSALFPKRVTYKKGVLIAAIISFMIMPWKLMENSESIFFFLNMIGAVLGPIIGVMLAQYFVIQRKNILIDELFMDTEKKNKENPYQGINMEAYIATIISLIMSMIGQFIPSLSIISNISFITGVGLAFIIYLGLKKLNQFRVKGD